MMPEQRMIHAVGSTFVQRRRRRSRSALAVANRPPIGAGPTAKSAGDVIAWVQERERGLRARIEALTQANDALLSQMRLAEVVQRSMLPRNLPSPPGFTLAASLRPTQYMAGDFYNAFRLDRDCFGLYLGDVMGHGPAAALLSVYVMQTIVSKRIEGNRYEILEPAAVLRRLHEDLMAADFPDQPFVTLAYGLLDAKNRTWTYCCGGHPPPLLMRRGEEPIRLDVNAPLLGVIEAPFGQSSIALRPGDRLALYTDGVESAFWGDRGYGIAGLAAWLQSRDGEPLQTLLDRTMAAVDFGSAPADDVAMLVMEVEG